MRFQTFILSCLLLLTGFVLEATHNRAGEITFERLGPLTYRATIVTYSVSSANAADRDTLRLFWGDGSSDLLYRQNGPLNGNGVPNGESVGNNTKVNFYSGTHTFAGPSTYTISFFDPNRNGNVVNIPSSINQPFYVESTIIIDPFGGDNASPILLNPPIDGACVGELFVHNPGAWDTDGDSLAYQLVACRGAQGQPISGYSIPTGASIDVNTGDLTWVPNLQGEYNFAILIEEWRNGNLLGTILRDLQVVVSDCANDPPVINTEDEYCVLAGDSLSFIVEANDENVGDWVTLSSSGGVYELDDSPAIFQEQSAPNTVSSTFGWQTNCSHVRKQAYNVLFVARDNATIPLSAQKTVSIQVVAPPVEIDTVQSSSGNLEIVWSKSECSNARGYSIYKGSYYGFVPSECETGVPAYTGYEKIGSTNDINDTTFLETLNTENLLSGQFCYMVVVDFRDGAESYASSEFCLQINQGLPVITNVSVLETDPDSGKIEVRWTRPLEIDSLIAPGPYQYKVYRSDSTGSVELVHTAVGLEDTVFVDSLINSNTDRWYYQIALENMEPGNEFEIGRSQFAQSLFLWTIPWDRQITLAWSDVTPWINELYYIYQRNDLGVFELIDSTQADSLVIDSLNNEQSYCFKVQSLGSYNVDFVPDSLLNWSQVSCDVPVDLVPPCEPELTLNSDCEAYFNRIDWLADTSDCASDVSYFNIYFKPTLSSDFQWVERVDLEESWTWEANDLESVAGCYYVTAVDTFDNESVIVGDGQCADNCPVYELPNIFTPNNDQFNDFFYPFPYRYIESVIIRIYNRWGEQVFYHEGDPNIRWNGLIENGSNASSGTYFYVCEVNEIRLTGIEPRIIKGYFTLLTEQNTTNPF